MKNLFQIIILSLTVNLFLTACSEQQRQDLTQKIKQKQIENAIKKLPTHNEPMPEYPQIKPPSELSNEQIDKNVQFVTTQIVHHENRIIYYSKVEKADGDREVIENKADSEYYRTILGTTADGNCAIQDFYSENDKKQIEPMIVKKDECESWKAQPFDGMAVWYDKNGTVDSTLNGISWFRQGALYAGVMNNEQNHILIYGEENIRPNVHRTVIVHTETPKDAQQPPAFECEFNEKENKIEKFIIFAGDKMVNKVAFHNDNKIDPSRLISWTADGYGFVDTMNTNKIKEIQEVADTLCGVKK
ncbi:MAG: hypothetical protein J6M43_00235 [Neisseriaceae bacterium]|nr:hypothetical protein [Neisseriaceae bacterium]